MKFKCFECGDDGHLAYDCPNLTHLRSTRPFERVDPDPPTAEYLAAREAMGEPSSGPALLAVACPWCHAPKWRRCVNVGTGRETDPHYARQEQAGVEQPSVRLIELAKRQVAESRAARELV
jgi:Zinc knuckle